jgi:hypothetical protein
MDNNPTHSPMILDLRDRMVRIETKLDAHHEAHQVIDRRLDIAEARQVALDSRIDVVETEIARGKAKFATAAGIGGGAVAILSALGDRFWNMFH